MSETQDTRSHRNATEGQYYYLTQRFYIISSFFFFSFFFSLYQVRLQFRVKRNKWTKTVQGKAFIYFPDQAKFKEQAEFVDPTDSRETANEKTLALLLSSSHYWAMSPGSFARSLQPSTKTAAVGQRYRWFRSVKFHETRHVTISLSATRFNFSKFVNILRYADNCQRVIDNCRRRS